MKIGKRGRENVLSSSPDVASVYASVRRRRTKSVCIFAPQDVASFSVLICGFNQFFYLPRILQPIDGGKIEPRKNRHHRVVVLQVAQMLRREKEKEINNISGVRKN